MKHLVLIPALLLIAILPVQGQQLTEPMTKGVVFPVSASMLSSLLFGATSPFGSRLIPGVERSPQTPLRGLAVPLADVVARRADGSNRPTQVERGSTPIRGLIPPAGGWHWSGAVSLGAALSGSASQQGSGSR
jgi:hypothetical protein